MDGVATMTGSDYGICGYGRVRTAQSPRHAAAAQGFVPTDARIEPSGFATILQAPSPAYPQDPPPPENRPIGGEAAWYARDRNITEAEARKRLTEQQALQPELERLLATLRKEEAGNFTAPRMVHAPDWAYELYFKHEPAATLARHTRNPRFKAALARYSRAELDALIQPWAARFQKAGILNGHGSDETRGTAEFMLALTRAEYARVAAREGWRLPNAITLRSRRRCRAGSGGEGAAFVRIFPQSDRSVASFWRAPPADGSCCRTAASVYCARMSHRRWPISPGKRV